MVQEEDICSNPLPLCAARSSERTAAAPGGFLLIKIKDESMISKNLLFIQGRNLLSTQAFNASQAVVSQIQPPHTYIYISYFRCLVCMCDLCDRFNGRNCRSNSELSPCCLRAAKSAENWTHSMLWALNQVLYKECVLLLVTCVSQYNMRLLLVCVTVSVWERWLCVRCQDRFIRAVLY